ncbi:MAG: hypothetical protein V1929_12025 [bacterium]
MSIDLSHLRLRCYNPPTKHRLRSIFMDLHRDLQGARILKNLRIERFEQGDDAMYDSMREMNRRIADREIEGHAQRPGHCSVCQKPAPTYDHLPRRAWRHVGLRRMQRTLRQGPQTLGAEAVAGIRVVVSDMWQLLLSSNVIPSGTTAPLIYGYRYVTLPPPINTYEPPPVQYVDASRPDDSGEGTGWSTAKRTIQAAVDLVQSGETVWVTNGVYDKGRAVTPGYALMNRVCVTNAINVQSMNGPEVTIIKGTAGSNGNHDLDSIRGILIPQAVSP